MKNLYKVLLIAALISLSNHSILSSGHFYVSFFSSETGYALIPDNLFISDAFNVKNSISLNTNSNHSFSAELNSGSYFILAVKSGFISFQTEFTIADNNEIRYSVFLDPVTSSQKLNSQRIKRLLKPDKTLLLGYAVDDITGTPLAGVVLKDAISKTLAITDANGYFEVMLPAVCEERTLINLTFVKEPFTDTKYESFELTPNTDFIFTVRMKSDGSKVHNNIPEKCEVCTSPSLLNDAAISGFVLPLNIRVGRNCTGTNCTYAEVYSLQTYCKYVLPAEIYACWGNLSGGMNSLEACAVAVRSYGMYYVYNPINPALYDICDNTYCQYFGSVLSTNTNNAVDNTFGYILTNSSGVVRSEYSAENNNKGCGDGYSGTGSSWPCIYDPVCLNGTPNGHGRGLCQWGTVRWATGRLVRTSSPCSQGNAHSYGTKTWQEILTHYYGVSPISWSVTLGTSAVINNSNAVPSASNPCSQITINNNITSNAPASLMIGASIAPTGTQNWISDPANDVKRNISQGTANYTRNFVIPCNTAPGIYDLYTALWYDKNNSNTIDGGDFVVSAR